MGDSAGNFEERTVPAAEVFCEESDTDDTFSIPAILLIMAVVD